MRFYANKWKSVYVPEVLAVGEGPATWDSYFSQQMRWAYGLIHILFTESPKVFKEMSIKHALNYFFLQQFYFDGIAQGIGVVLLTMYFIFGIQSASMPLMPLFYLYIPILFIQIVISIWLQRTNIDTKNESGLLLRGKLLSLAAWPIYLLALVGVLTDKGLTYKVTPKGSAQTTDFDISLFYPHLIIASVSAIGLVLGVIAHHTAVQIVFFGILNMICMYSIVFVASYKSIKSLVFGMFKRIQTFEFIRPNVYSNDIIGQVNEDL